MQHHDFEADEGLYKEPNEQSLITNNIMIREEAKSQQNDDESQSNAIHKGKIEFCTSKRLHRGSNLILMKRDKFELSGGFLFSLKFINHESKIFG